MQLEQEVAPGSDATCPAAQGEHVVRPLALFQLPTGHGEHASWPVEGWNEPLPHSEQAVSAAETLPPEEEKEPEAHGRHAVMPVALANEPGTLQVSISTKGSISARLCSKAKLDQSIVESLFAHQLRQAACPEAPMANPLSQALHTMAPVATSLYLPGWQARHSVAAWIEE